MGYSHIMEQKKNKIKLLTPELANQIAAGEVVERPASVLKELVENSLDAGATSVFATIEDGGQASIRVSDNGVGIPQEELALALTRHATSKIQKQDDLWLIGSFGFRGEALPSIASVSRFRIASCYKYAAEKQGYALDVLFGEHKELCPHSIQEGTQIEVRDLFNNVPARLKFLKNPATELKKAQEIFTRMALVREDVSFTLNAGTREVISMCAGESMLQRLSRIWPSHMTESLLQVESKSYGIRVFGYISHPQSLLSKADKIFFYVNGRPVTDKLLLRALKQAYQKHLTTKDFPQALLCIELPLDEVDVNVHPAKSEVRFRDEQSVFKAVHVALEKALSQVLIFSAENSFLPENNKEEEYSYPTLSGGFSSSKIYSRYNDLSPFNQGKRASFNSNYSSENWAGTFEVKSLPKTRAEVECRVNIADVPTNHEGIPLYLGQVARSYLVFQQANSHLLVLDQHAVHERILFEKYKNNSRHASRNLLIPLEYPLHSSEKEAFYTHKEVMAKLGFEIELPPNEEKAVILAIPIEFDEQTALAFLGNTLKNNDCNPEEIWIDHACDAALKANQQLTETEAYTLYSKWLQCDEPDYCPHGRPCYILMDAAFFEKFFKR